MHHTFLNITIWEGYGELMLWWASQTFEGPNYISQLRWLTGQTDNTHVFHGHFWVVIIYDPHLFSGPDLNLSHIKLINDPPETGRPWMISQRQSSQWTTPRDREINKSTTYRQFPGCSITACSPKISGKNWTWSFCGNGRNPISKLESDRWRAETKPKHHRVFSITEWLHGLAVYLAVLSCTQPSCMPDQMGYQPLSEFRNAFWLGYDR